jgi:transcriptional regulator GlxA family with amidase domain
MDSRVYSVLAALDESYPSPLTLEELSSGVGLSVSRLQHLFRQSMGMSITAYLRRLRLSAAAELLSATELQVLEIAYRVGFATAAGFTHAFQSQYREAPKAYRHRVAKARQQARSDPLTKHNP